MIRARLTGNATFLRLPAILDALEALPKDRPIELDLSGLRHLDHACLTALTTWADRHNTPGTAPVRLGPRGTLTDTTDDGGSGSAPVQASTGRRRSRTLPHRTDVGRVTGRYARKRRVSPETSGDTRLAHNVSVVVPVPVMTDVPVTVVHVVHVVPVRHRDMPAPVAMLVRVVAVSGVPARFTLVHMAVVNTMEVTVVHIVHVVLVRDGHVAAALAVLMHVVGMGGMCCGHDVLRSFLGSPCAHSACATGSNSPSNEHRCSLSPWRVRSGEKRVRWGDRGLAEHVGLHRHPSSSAPQRGFPAFGLGMPSPLCQQ